MSVPEEMTAFIKRSASPGDAGVGTARVPAPGRGQVLVQVAACGICGSDLHTVQGHPGYEWVRTPAVIGHECSGVVVGVGEGVEVVSKGDRVVAVSIQGCLRCRTCQSGATQLCPDRQILGLHYNGGLAEYVVVPERQLVAVPDRLDLRRAALTEPLTVAVHAVLGRSQVKPTSRVVVSGPGPIGLLCAQVARACGGDVLVLGIKADTGRRLAVAEQLGLRTADIDSERTEEAVRRHFGEHPPDVWLEASGAVAALEAAVRSMAPRGHITVVAMFTGPYELMVPDILRREVTITTSYAASVHDYLTALELIRDGVVEVEPLIDEFPLERTDEAFMAAVAGKAVKPLVVACADLLP